MKGNALNEKCNKSKLHSMSLATWMTQCFTSEALRFKPEGNAVRFTVDFLRMQKNDVDDVGDVKDRGDV